MVFKAGSLEEKKELYQGNLVFIVTRCQLLVQPHQNLHSKAALGSQIYISTKPR